MNADNKALAGSYTTFAPVGNPYPDDSKALAIMNRPGFFQLIDPDTNTLITSNVNDVASKVGLSVDAGPVRLGGALVRLRHVSVVQHRSCFPRVRSHRP